MKKKWITIFLLLALLIPGLSNLFPAETPPPEKEKEEKTEKPKSHTIPLTLFIPGIDQFKSRQYIKGGLMLGAFTACLTGAIINNSKGNQWYKKYQDAAIVEDVVHYRQQTEKSMKRRNFFMIAAFSIWVIHVLDVKFLKSGKAGVKSELGQDSLRLSFYYTF